ncbi:MAG: LacI family DNA-binding transcriptional regulator [Candidatus Acidiferrum sp.]
MGSMNRRSQKPRLVDVARAANVSTATVSRLMTGRAGVTPRLRDRILKAAVSLGFQLDGGGKSRIIAFLLSNRGVLHPFHSAVLMGAEAYAAEHDYGLLFLPYQYSTKVPWQELYLPAIFQRRQVISGVIVAGTNSPNLLQLLTHREIPWVVLGNNVIGDETQREVCAVCFDDIGGAYELTRYLISLGHREIGFVGNRQLPWFARRFQGYQRAMNEAGLQIHAGEFNSTNHEEMGYLATKLILQQAESLTAIFAGDDAAARGAYNAARDRGLRIPEDLSVAGFNDTTEASVLQPPLTSVHVFTDEVGKQLAELLIERITRPDLPARTVSLPTQVVRRESCAPLLPIPRTPADSGENRDTSVTSS